MLRPHIQPHWQKSRVPWSIEDFVRTSWINCQIRHQILRAQLEATNGYIRLVSDVSTRCYSMRIKIVSLLRNRLILENLITSRGQMIFGECGTLVQDMNFWSNLEEASDTFEPLCELIAYSEAKDAVLSKAFEKLVCWGLQLDNNQENKYRLSMFEAYLTNFTRLDLGLLPSCLVCDGSCSNNHLTDGSTDASLKRVERER